MSDKFVPLTVVEDSKNARETTNPACVVTTCILSPFSRFIEPSEGITDQAVLADIDW
jgi:hypothetical protein